MKTLTQEQLEKRLKVWQRRMLLQAWTIRVTLSPKWAKGPGTTFGQCWPDYGSKQAQIKILRPEDFDEESCVPEYDAEATLVHELIHVMYAEAEPRMKTAEYANYEMAVEQMSKVLMNAYGRKK